MLAVAGYHLEGLGMKVFFSLFLLKGMESPHNLQLRAKLSGLLMQEPEESSRSSFGFSEWEEHEASVSSWQISFPPLLSLLPGSCACRNHHFQLQKQHSYSHSISSAPFPFLKFNPGFWGTSFSHAFLLKSVGLLIWINCGKLGCYSLEKT